MNLDAIKRLSHNVIKISSGKFNDKFHLPLNILRSISEFGYNFIKIEYNDRLFSCRMVNNFINKYYTELKNFAEGH